MNLLLQLVLIILVVVLIMFIVLAIMWILKQRRVPGPGPIPPPPPPPPLTGKLGECCSAVPVGHCGKIRLPKGVVPIGDDDGPGTWGWKPVASGGVQANSGIRVQIIAAGFFDPLFIPRDPIEPIVTIHNEGKNMMYVGRYFQSGTHEFFHTHIRVPPEASVTVTWWELWHDWPEKWPPTGHVRFFFQLAVTGKDAKGCYVVSWCCPDRIRVKGDPYVDADKGATGSAENVTADAETSDSVTDTETTATTPQP